MELFTRSDLKVGDKVWELVNDELEGPYYIGMEHGMATVMDQEGFDLGDLQDCWDEQLDDLTGDGGPIVKVVRYGETIYPQE